MGEPVVWILVNQTSSCEENIQRKLLLTFKQ